MRKSWPFALAVVVVGGLAGLAIAGRPVPNDPFVLDPRVTIAEPTSPTSVVGSTASIADPVTTTTMPANTTVAVSTSVAPTTVAPTTTITPTTTAAPTTVVAPIVVPGPLPRNQVRLVIANGDGRFRLASTTADRIRPLGYLINLGDSVSPVVATVLYYRPGFDDEAAFAAIDIGVPEAIIIAFPTNLSGPITNSDDGGDIIIVLGADAPR